MAAAVIVESNYFLHDTETLVENNTGTNTQIRFAMEIDTEAFMIKLAPRDTWCIFQLWQRHCDDFDLLKVSEL